MAMLRAMRNARKMVTIAISDCSEKPLSVAPIIPFTAAIDPLSLEKKVIFLPENKRVVAASRHGHSVRVYYMDIPGEPRITFTRHTAEVRDVQLDDDLVASVGADGYLFTWRPSRSSRLPGRAWHHRKS